MNDYKIKSTTYYSNLREDVLAYIPKIAAAKMLDIGCSSGNLLCFLKQNNLIDEAVGVDFMDIPNSNQQSPLINTFIVADVQQQQLSLTQNYFDIMVCADVLEHLLDPWAVLQYLKTFLKKEATLIVSLPNIQEYTALKSIALNGDFKYATSGILDKTHMRFFCKKNIKALVSQAGFVIQSCEPSFKTGNAHKKRKIINTLTFGIFEQFLAQQYIVVARNK
jgi:2-polyprenyl-3-methyl-5-hydroxy-6-metoxy-1,4-benzoquinol methylase